MKYNIVLIGAGQIGSRHLQAIRNIHQNLSITVVDSKESSLKVCQQRYEEVEVSEGEKEISFTTSLADINNPVDVCIIATNSNVRAKVTEELLSTVSVKNIIFEKVLFQKIEEYDFIEALLKSKGVKAWVNCPRRLFPIYKNLRKKLASLNKPMHLSVVGGEWGMASNSIHFIDLASFLCEESSYNISFINIDDTLIESKRVGFSEICGTISGTFVNGASFYLKSIKGAPAIHSVNITTQDNIHVVDEINQLHHQVINSDNCNFNHKIFIPYQSGLTNIIIESIISDGSCELTPFEESCQIHKPLINGIKKQMSKSYSYEQLNSYLIT